MPMATACCALRAALDEADGYALLDIDDAVRLRQAGYPHPILLLKGFFGYDDLPVLAEYRLTAVVHAWWQVELLEAAVLPVALPVLVKLNSGLNRLGFEPQQFREAVKRLQACHAVSDITLMTHFADADGSRGIAGQLSAFSSRAADSSCRCRWRIPRPCCAFPKCGRRNPMPG